MGNHYSCEYNGCAIECVNSHEFVNANNKMGSLAAHLCMTHLAIIPSKKGCPSIHMGNPHLHTGIRPTKFAYGNSPFAKLYGLHMVITIHTNSYIIQNKFIYTNLYAIPICIGVDYMYNL
jgi:hypothetical protein